MSQKQNVLHEISQTPETLNLTNNVHIDENSIYNLENNCSSITKSIEVNPSVHINYDLNTNTHLEQEFNAIDHTLQFSSQFNTCHVDALSSNLVLDEYRQQCLMCMNGDMPTGMHRCQLCKKALHLFGCSVPADQTEEGCEESRICLQ